MDVNINGYVVLLTQECSINLKYLVNSTDPKNFGKKKEGKEWQQIVLPLTSDRALELMNAQSARPHILTSQDLIYHSVDRLQIREEIRKTKLSKTARTVEISFHLPPNLKRKRLEDRIVDHQIKRFKAELNEMTSEELEAKALALGLETH